MFSQTAEYALRIVAHLAAHYGAAQTTHQIARATRVPEGYLSKILQILGRSGLVSSQRGLHGGSMLARNPRELTMLQVIECVSPLPRVTGCPLGIGSHGSRLCPLHRRLAQGMSVLEQTLAQAMMAQVLEESSGPLCEGEEAPDADADRTPMRQRTKSARPRE